jgi:hypothetical protein
MVLERNRRKKAIWDELLKIVERLLKNNHSFSFRTPVDWKTLKIPDYLTFVKKPM